MFSFSENVRVSAGKLRALLPENCHKLKSPKGLLANGVGSRAAVSWEPVRGADGYEIYEKNGGEDFFRIQTVALPRTVLENRKPGTKYIYKVRAYRLASGKLRFGKWSREAATEIALNGKTTLKNLLRTALMPLGTTMYIWGGGWNEEDNGTGADGCRLGLSPAWRAFANLQTPFYQYGRYRYWHGLGLDCSGYLGWVLYNVMNTEHGSEEKGYVLKAGEFAPYLAKKGWGTCVKPEQIQNYRAGDIMSTDGHVYLVIGECSDKSVVLLHCSPPGVQLCGTCMPDRDPDSEAVKLVKRIMKTYQPFWYLRYPKCERDISYLTEYLQFRWVLDGNGVMTDPDRYRDAAPEFILKELFREGR